MSVIGSNLFASYWERKKSLQVNMPIFKLKKWWLTDGLCEIEQVYFDIIKSSKSVLDIGAGDLRLKNKFMQIGFKGIYDTQDISKEFNHTYVHLNEIQKKYNVVLCMDVIEHMTLEEGLVFLEKILSFIAPGGYLILQTPNARCVRNPLAWDMTHRHCYNLADLWALLTGAGYEATGYRVVFAAWGIKNKVYSIFGRFIITRLLGCDYADNISVIAQKKNI